MIGKFELQLWYFKQAWNVFKPDKESHFKSSLSVKNNKKRNLWESNRKTTKNT